MRRAADYLLGEHDFMSFCANKRMKKSTVRKLESIRIEEQGSRLLFWYTGNGFLYNMVRILTGTLLEVGLGKRKPEDMESLLSARDRSLAGPLVPAQGLFLWNVDYGEKA